jgi:hypothetical protein
MPALASFRRGAGQAQGAFRHIPPPRHMALGSARGPGLGAQALSGIGVSLRDVRAPAHWHPHTGAHTLAPARWPRSVHAPTCRLPVIHFKPLPEMLQIARRSIGQMRIIGEQLSARMTQHARAAQRGNRASRCQQAGIFSRSRQMPVTAIGAALGKRTCTPQRLIGRLGSFKGLVQLFTDHCVRTGPWQVSPKLVSNKISIV